MGIIYAALYSLFSPPSPLDSRCNVAPPGAPSKTVRCDALLSALELLAFDVTAPGSTDLIGAHWIAVVEQELELVKTVKPISDYRTLNTNPLLGLALGHASRLVGPLLERVGLLVGDLLPASDHLLAAGAAGAYTYGRRSRPKCD